MQQASPSDPETRSARATDLLANAHRRFFKIPPLVAASLAVALLALAACTSPEQRAQSYLDHGKQLADQGQLDKAALEYRNALQLKPDLVPAIYALGVIAEKKGDYKSAMGSFRDVADRDVKNVDARVHLGQMLVAAGQLDSALKYADEAYALAPERPDVLALKAAVALKLGDAKSAVDYAQSALKAAPGDLNALMVLAAERLKAKDPKAALAFLDQASGANDRNVALQLFRLAALQALKDDAGVEGVLKKLAQYYPSDIGFRDALAKWYISKGRKDDAEAVLRSFAAANPKNIQAELAVVSFLRSQKGNEAATAELQAQIDKGGDTFPFQIALAQLTIASGKVSEATDFLNKLIETTTDAKNKTAARVLLARLLVTQKDWAGAGKLADTVLAEDAHNVDGLAVRAAIRMNNGKVDDAITDLRTALNQAPQSAPLILLLADAYERNSNFDLANDQYAKAVQIAKFTPGVALAYAQFLLRYGKADQAERVLTESRSRAPNNAQVLTLLARLKLDRKDWVGAQEIADALRKLNSTADNSTADQIVAGALSGQQKYDEALTVLQSAQSDTDLTGSPMAALVRAYVAAGKADAAAQFLQSVLKSSPDNQLAQVLMASLDALNKKPAEAEAAYRAAIAAKPDAPLGYLALIQYYAGTGRLDEAEQTAKDGLAHAPGNAQLQLQLAGILERAGKYSDAINLYETMIKADPRSTVIANNLASLLSDYGTDPGRLDRALEIASRFRTSDVPQFVDTLGWVYYLKGDYTQALTLLKTSADRMPGVAAAQYHLGMTYKALGQDALAQASLEHAVKVAGTAGFPQLDKAKAALDALAQANGTPSNVQ